MPDAPATAARESVTGDLRDLQWYPIRSSFYLMLQFPSLPNPPFPLTPPVLWILPISGNFPTIYLTVFGVCNLMFGIEGN